jgi:hypothetical protein
MAFTRVRNWAKTRRASARLLLIHEAGHWYAVASGHHVSSLLNVRGGTIVGFGRSPVDALRDCTEILDALAAIQCVDTTSAPGGW